MPKLTAAEQRHAQTVAIAVLTEQVSGLRGLIEVGLAAIDARFANSSSARSDIYDRVGKLENVQGRLSERLKAATGILAAIQTLIMAAWAWLVMRLT